MTNDRHSPRLVRPPPRRTPHPGAAFSNSSRCRSRTSRNWSRRPLPSVHLQNERQSPARPFRTLPDVLDLASTISHPNPITPPPGSFTSKTCAAILDHLFEPLRVSSQPPVRGATIRDASGWHRFGQSGFPSHRGWRSFTFSVTAAPHRHLFDQLRMS